MKEPVWRIMLLGGFCLGSLATAAGQCPTWQPAPAFPGGPRKGAGAVNHHGTLVVAGGRPFVGLLSSVHYLPPGGAAWLSGTPLSNAVFSPGACTDALDRLLIVGGYTVEDHYPFYFPVATGRIYDLVAGETGTIPSVPHPRAYTAFAQDAQLRLYVIGGLTTTGNTVATVDRYDALANAWTTLANLPAPRAYPTAVGDGLGHVLVFGGIDSAGNIQNTVFSLEIATGLWTTLAPQPAALKRQAAVRGANGRVYLVGGNDGYSDVRHAYTLDSINGLWVPGPLLATARSGAAVALGDDGFIYVLGGESGALGTDTAEKLDTRPALPALDCNGNQVNDLCDIAAGVSTDCNSNSLPDECEQSTGDCNSNGVPDLCETVGPVFRIPPQNCTCPLGELVTFKTAVRGTGPLTYRWRHDGVPLVNGVRITGVTTSFLQIADVRLEDAGTYDVLVTDACAEAASAQALLTVEDTTADCNCDGVVTWRDIDPFILALYGTTAYYGQFPHCRWLNADANHDELVTWRDIDPFIAHLNH